MMSIENIPTEMFRQGLTGLEWRLQPRLSQAFTDTDLAASAIIFAPHPDDETLACGGTMLRKHAAGADMQVVFMTDGRSSHAHLMPADDLAVLRYEEGVAACKKLGLSENDVSTLNFPDNHLSEHHAEAVAAVRKILSEHRPQTVFMPYVYDITPDHEATARIILKALHAEGRKTILYEYPIWVWNHFPWMHFALRPKQQAFRYLTTTLSTGLGLGMLFNFRHHVNIQAQLAEKYLALEEHHSQMKRLVDDPSWGTLGDVSEGRFLACFFQGVEIFRRSVVGVQS